ncbi:MAG: hypothetical protein VKJ44_06720 [Synechococcus sp.]|nr:hypothetical protein [Synechococcus sp.]
MSSPDAVPGRPGREDDGANTDLIRLIAAAADLCRKPLRHGVVPREQMPAAGQPLLEVCLRLEARTTLGARCPEQDLELEIYRSGSDLHLTLAWLDQDQRPMLWHGSHAVWMDGAGQRCPPPEDGAPLEALARRLRSLLAASV